MNRHKNDYKHDAFTDGVASFAHVVAQRKKAIVTAIVSILLLVFLSIFWNYYEQGVKAEWSHKIFEIDSQKDDDKIAAYHKLITQQGTKNLKGFIGLELADLLIAKKDFINAEKQIQQSAAATSVVISTLAKLNLAALSINQNKLEEAKKILSALASETKNPFKNFAKVELAKLLLSQKNYVEFDKILKEISDEAGEDPMLNQLVQEQKVLAAIQKNPLLQ